MTHQVTEQDMQGWFNAWNSHDVEQTQAIFSEDVVIYEPLVPQPLQGKSGLAAFFGPLFKTYPNIHFAGQHVVVQDNEAVSFELVTGTMTGPGHAANGREIAPTGKSFTIKGAIRLRFNDDGKINLVDIYWDRLLFFQQLGLPLD